MNTARRFRLAARRRPRLQGLSFNRLLPNILTMIGLCVGLNAIRLAFEGRWPAAVALIVVAAFIDGIDGRLARLLKATSRFGAEFDSLSDFVCFGVAPGLILYLWSLDGARGVGFIPCVLFAVCMALRLARFNAAIDIGPVVTAKGVMPPPPKPAYAQSFFTGVPAPAGAGLALFPVFASLSFQEWGMTGMAAFLRHPLFVALVLVLVAGLLVSTLPTWSFKNFKIPREAVLPLLLGAAAYAALLVTEPWAAIAAAGLIYVSLLPFSIRSYQRLKREAEEMRLPEPASGPEAEQG
ncbi:CDP-diacylglycerol--serine O-phosphatidyltransferase [Roseomonas mucosa]|uniref:CDP-diacylglycerol--serine O-phosphatidyltransferase n=1 Tax=Roseomonas mucosa TaxID=207340 RepID=A0A1S8D9K7_9PROT|nr:MULTISPECIES: phosphatidylcholine/phosphatidylserine synthase [Roseomonas]MBS5902012.1 phosphatidylcholine/phosphatidylserine synthase [Acetobacteraceae bacterium]MDT8262576.1 phosphatidylcholine/phosphatidylserine synthase [Roseomonas sp. DSM 102946]ATR21118.1 CDP-diacylglycerol--serine O-phosphatidyltransferase [Roseomonas sp. FDAARGOS_362]AWV22303.1 CDP-diacylglycerol--serine O-phosphatidyltransferase [Roseomonas mucosa]MCG7352110.1 phosphatidylcholine/phosphatidylserine synthase [Roseom